MFSILVYIPRSGLYGPYVNTLFNFFEEIPDHLPKWLHHFTFLAAMFESSNFSTTLLTLVIVCVFLFQLP